MQRSHIHFAQGLPGDSGVISGMRARSQVHIFIDMEKALADGYKFFLSVNGVALCPGNEQGLLPPHYFSRVVETSSG
jgi:2'-phosphotransferase